MITKIVEPMSFWSIIQTMETGKERERLIQILNERGFNVFHVHNDKLSVYRDTGHNYEQLQALYGQIPEKAEEFNLAQTLGQIIIEEKLLAIPLHTLLIPSGVFARYSQNHNNNEE